MIQLFTSHADFCFIVICLELIQVTPAVAIIHCNVDLQHL